MIADAVQVHAQVIGAADRKVTLKEREEAQELEAKKVLEIIERHMPEIRRAQDAGEEYRVAILVRARQHLAKIARLMRQRGIRVPRGGTGDAGRAAGADRSAVADAGTAASHGSRGVAGGAAGSVVRTDAAGFAYAYGR